MMREGQVGPGLLARMLESFALLQHGDADLLQAAADLLAAKIGTFVDVPEQLQSVVQSFVKLGHNDTMVQNLLNAYTGAGLSGGQEEEEGEGQQREQR